MKLIAAQPGEFHPEIELVFSDYLPDGFRVAVVEISPPPNGDDCRPPDYQRVMVDAINAGIQKEQPCPSTTP